ncbi:hypothetical protein HPT25_11930 [Bacillus sp. BRMEA1]|uniref:hypothetical protein n=1 Tax=Neobacillus endophyticus TaxID=2738405 RepID=UPI0015677703|nr:hypothetical protein [Neobacillus endophyticus]NRD78096.1 hypothetical protein [Neobacillus endophyticus]
MEAVTRFNIKLKAEEETEINGVSPHISSQQWEELLSQLDGLVDGDFMVLSGSIPSSLNENAYSDIAEYLSNRNIHKIYGRKLVEQGEKS